MINRPYEFRHPLTRDAAYELLPPSERGELHQATMESLVALHGEPTSGAVPGDVSIEMANHALAASRVTGQVVGHEREACRAAAKFSQSRGYFADSVKYWERVAELSEGQARADALESACNSELNSGGTQRALKFIQQALEIEHDDDYRRLSCTNTKSIVYLAVGRLEDAKALLQSILNDVDETKYAKEVVVSQTNLSNVQKHLGEVEDATASLRRAYDIAKASDQHIPVVSVVASLGTLAMAQEDWDTAEQYLNQASKIAAETGDPVEAALSLGDLASVYRHTDRRSLARSAYADCIGRLEALGMRAALALYTANLGHFLVDEGDDEAALKCFVDAIEVCHETGSVRTLAVAQRGVGHVYLRRELYAKAREAFVHSVKSAVVASNRAYEVQHRVWLALAYARELDFANSLVEWKIAKERCEAYRLPATCLVPVAVRDLHDAFVSAGQDASAFIVEVD